MSERRYVRIPVSFLVYVFALLSGGAIGASIVLVAVDAFRAAPCGPAHRPVGWPGSSVDRLAGLVHRMSAHAQAVALRSEVGPSRLEELAASIRQQHQTVLDSLRRTLESAIACGEALDEARTMVPTGLWQSWLDENVGLSRPTANLYVRIAHFREELYLVGAESISAAQTCLRGNDLVLKVPQHPDEKIAEVQALHQRGLTRNQISRQTGIPPTTVKRWVRSGMSRARIRVTSGERPAEAVPDRIGITNDMIEGMARWLAVRGRMGLTDQTRAQATEALRVALNYRQRSGASREQLP